MSTDGHRSGVVGRLGSLHRGQQLAVVVVAGYLLFLGVSAATAPPLTRTAGVDPGDNGTVTNGTLDERATLVGLQGPFRGKQGYAKLVSGNGSTVWQGGETWANFDVSPVAGDRVLTAFIRKGATDCGGFGPPCPRTGFRIYDRGTGSLVREWTYPVRRTHNSEVHDVELLPDGEVLVVGMFRERIFAVDESGRITWQWNASERYVPPENPTRVDWLHMNDVDRIGEDRYLVSIRNANELLIVERGEGVVDVINEGGDDGVLRKQHNPQWIGEGRVLVADSDNDRVVELRERNGTWEVAWKLRGAGGIPFHWPRDADLLANGNVLVTDSFNNRVVEVTRNGSLVWSVSPGKIPYEADRLADGEYPSESFGGNATVAGTGRAGRTEVPGLSFLFSVLAGVAPVPYWMNQWHLLGLLVSLPACAGGLLWSRYAG